MEFKILLYIIGFIIYSIYSARKAAKKRNELREQRNPASQDRNYGEELKEFVNRAAASTQEQNHRFFQEVKNEVEEEEEEWEDPMYSGYQMPEVKEYEAHRKSDWKEHLAQEKYSVEVDQTTLAEHIKELESSMERKTSGHSVGHEIFHGEEFDARKAFIYSEIFRAKYQED